MHYMPTPQDRPAPDVDADGYDPRAHFAPPARVTTLDTPGTADYRVVPVRSTTTGVSV